MHLDEVGALEGLEAEEVVVVVAVVPAWRQGSARSEAGRRAIRCSGHEGLHNRCIEALHVIADEGDQLIGD